MIREEIEVFWLAFRLVVELQFRHAVYADKRNMHRDQQHNCRRQDSCMQNVEPRQCVFVIRVSGQQHPLGEAAYDRHGVAEIRSNRRAPVTELFEHQAVPGEAGQQRAHQQ